jgi:hypothetical protein
VGLLDRQRVCRDKSTGVRAVCAGGSDPYRGAGLLSSISDSGQAGFLDSQYRAALAELQQLKPVLLSKEELQTANERFLNTFVAGEIERLDVRSLSREARCWIARKDFAAVTTRKNRIKNIWARACFQEK